MPDLLEVRVKSVTYEADGILSYDLRPAGSGAAPAFSGGDLPAFTAGAHIDLHLPDGLVRSYSLVNPQDERHRYVIAVQREPESRGGSRQVHQRLHPGDLVTIAPPRNNFPLAEDARHSILIAGGIGITPVWCMAQRLEALGRSFELYYCVRRRALAAFLEPVEAMARRRPGGVHVTFDAEGGSMLDLAALMARAAPDVHFYCCGPLAMLDAFEAASASRDRDRVHTEYFTTREVPATEGGFTVVLARSGTSVQVPHGSTIIDALFKAGIDVPHSCLEGVCGTCETRVISGEPDHRDLVLTDAERAAGKTMMICCSGSKGDTLVLDL
jgi:vanillate O-demethylase ferredoxin subunit